jgi:hypothetical protein
MPGAITNPLIEEAYHYWARVAAGRAIPRRADLDPVDIPRLLPHVMLVEVHEPRRYRYRLIGTANDQEHGISVTGRWLDEVLPGPDYSRHILGLYDECVDEGRPLYTEIIYLSPARGNVERHLKALFLPLSEDGARVNQVFVIRIFLHLDPNTRHQHLLHGRPYKELVRERL